MDSAESVGPTHDPSCEWCAGTGWRGSKPYQWYAANPEVMTTMFPCDCDTPCPTCGGKGYIEQENWHEMEVWACPKCKPGIVGEIV